MNRGRVRFQKVGRENLRYLRWPIGPVLVTTVPVFWLLVLNVSALGMVEVPTSAIWVYVELALRLVTLVGIYAATIALLERRRLTGWAKRRSAMSC